MNEWLKKNWPFVVGLLVVAYLALRNKGGGTTSVQYTSMIPAGQYNPAVDAVAIAKLQTQGQVIGDYLGSRLRRDELASTERIAEIQARNAAQIADASLQRIFADRDIQLAQVQALRESRFADVEGARQIADLQYLAQQRLASSQSQGQLYNLLANLGQGVMSLLRGGQSGSAGRSSGGSSSGSGFPGSPPFNPNASTTAQRARQQSALAAVGNWLTRYFNQANYGQITPLVEGVDYDPLGYIDPIDLGQWDWLDYYGGNPFVTDYFDFVEPIGTVTGDFDFGGIIYDDES